MSLHMNEHCVNDIFGSVGGNEKNNKRRKKIYREEIQTKLSLDGINTRFDFDKCSRKL